MPLEQLEREGFIVVSGVLNTEELGMIRGLLDSVSAAGNPRGGTRDVLCQIPDLEAVAAHSRVKEIVKDVLGAGAFLVRATLFDKTPDANWKVPWHQDLTIAVKERVDRDGYGPWSVKNDVIHVQAPTEVLERMITLRIHIDPCPATNGALRVMPKSHRLGRLNQNEVSCYVYEDAAACCEAKAGDALVMRPLLLHASSASHEPGHRRVLHFDYAVGGLATGLLWRLR